MRQARVLVLLAVLVMLSGCASQIGALSQDPSIIWMTGWIFSVGMQPTPTSNGVPVPSLFVGHVTQGRIGPTDSATVTVGSGAVYNSGTGTGTTGEATANGNASLVIHTEGTSKVIHEQQHVVQFSPALTPVSVVSEANP